MSAAETSIAWANPASLASELSGRLSPESRLYINEPLARRTTLRVGGPADLLVEPGSERDLADTLRFAAERGWPVFVLGRGSNLLVRDGGFRGVAICLAHPAFGRIEAEGNRLRCGAGARLKAVAGEARRRGLGGLEFLEGIPGTVGGALRMNAGAMGSWTFGAVECIRYMNHSGEAVVAAPGELDVRYRGCASLRGHVALEAVFLASPGCREEIQRRMDDFSGRRWKSQPAAPSAGCMFKNPETVPAGRLIDELGLKGVRVGGAMVSLEHGNFIVNTGGATARDVLQLVELVRERARRERGIELETEVEIVGED